MRRLLFGAAATFTLFFMACDPQPDPVPDPEGTVKLLFKDVTDTDSSILSYDTSKRFTLFEQHDLSDGFTVFVKPVFENNRLAAALVGLSKSDITHKFKTFNYYSAGNLRSVYSYEMGFDKPARIDSLLYDASGRLTTSYVSVFASVGAEIGLYQKNLVEWNDKGNIVRKYSIAMEGGKETKDTTTTVYTYDNKINYVAKQPDYAMMQLEEIADVVSANNILSAVVSGRDTRKEIANECFYDYEEYPNYIRTTEKEFSDGSIVNTTVRSHKLMYIKR